MLSFGKYSSRYSLGSIQQVCQLKTYRNDRDYFINSKNSLCRNEISISVWFNWIVGDPIIVAARFSVAGRNPGCLNNLLLTLIAE